MHIYLTITNYFDDDIFLKAKREHTKHYVSCYVSLIHFSRNCLNTFLRYKKIYDIKTVQSNVTAICTIIAIFVLYTMT